MMIKSLKQYPLIAFFIITFMVSWAPWYLTGDPKLLGWAPSIVGIVMAFAVGGKQGLRDLLQRALHWRVSIRLWLVAVFGQAIIMLSAIALYALLVVP